MPMAEGGLPPTRPLKRRVILIVFVALLTVIYTAKHFEPMRGRWDFESFYLVAKMVREGNGPRLYDLSAQADYQRRYIDPLRPTSIPDLPFLYPAATAVLFLPLAWLPVPLAYAAWTAFSLALLVLSVRLLQRHLQIPQDDRPIFAALLFMPVFACLLHGQISIVMLFLYATAFSWFKRGNPFIAGIALGLGTLKFQLMLGFYGILLLRRCWKALAGAAIGAVPIALLSAAVLGWRGALEYPLTIMHSAHIANFDTVRTMISAYGLLTGALGHQPPSWLLASLSIGMIVAAAVVQDDQDNKDIAFAAAVVTSILVSYHAFLQEFTLLLLPAAVIGSRIQRTSTMLFSFVTAFAGITALLYLEGVQVAAAVTYAMVIFGLWYAKTRAALAAAVETQAGAG